MGKPPKHKVPGFASTLKPDSSKVPRTAIDDPQGTKLKPSWQFRSLKLDGKWSCENLTSAETLELRTALANYETMTWGEIDKDGGSHYIEWDKLEREAQKCMEDRKLHHFKESLYSLRLTGKKRVWGIREAHVLRIIWWDPEHEICPAKLKNT